MIHLLPLPGSARYTKGRRPLIVNTTLRNLEALETGRADAALVENLGDVPFAKRVPTDTIAIMTAIVEEIMRKARFLIGVNVLREGK